jgi:hypothetical protein
MNDLHVTDDPKRIGFYSGLVVRFRYKLFDCMDMLTELNGRVGKHIRCIPTRIDLSSSEAFG